MTQKDLLLFIAKKEAHNLLQIPLETPVHTLALSIAASLWINEVPDDEEAVEFREEMKYFIEHKKFSFQ